MRTMRLNADRIRTRLVNQLTISSNRTRIPKSHAIHRNTRKYFVVHSLLSSLSKTCCELHAHCCAISIRKSICLSQPFVLNLTKTIFSRFRQAHLSRALALTALGHIDDAIVAHCLSAHFNGAQSNYSNVNRLELAKVSRKRGNAVVCITY